MKVYVSYVIQNENGHKHDSIILNIKSPPYSYSSDPPVSSVIEWAQTKQSKLREKQKMIITSMYKV